MKKREIYYIIAVLLLVINTFMMTKEVQYIRLPSKTNTKVITNTLPVKTVPVDGTLTIPKVVRFEQQKNDTLLKLYNDAIDSIQKLQLFKEVISERTYREELKDSVQTITVETTVTGFMREQNISYVTNPVNIEKKSLKSRTSLYLGGFSLLPTESERPISLGADLNIVTKSNIFSIGIDNQRNIKAGLAFKLF
ncbi:MAG: hypothetical protein AAGC43_04645 [Bacteroidota bacterium]